MTEAPKSNLQSAATERATLRHMLTQLKNRLDLLETSKAEHTDKYYVSTANIPRDINALNKVLFRFFEANKIKDLFELVDLKPELLDNAIEFTKNPLKGSSRSAYNEAYISLRTIKNNLDDYKQFSTKNTKFTAAYQKATGDEASSFQNNDGFKNYVAKARLIVDAAESYNEVMVYTGSPELNLDNLPKTVKDLSNMRLAIAAPGDSGTTAQPKVESVESDGRFEVGGEQYLALINKSARETATADVTQRKYVCYKDAVQFRLDYNDCVTTNQNDSTNLDLLCEPKKVRYEISKANCDSHYPMITISDALIEDIFSKVEKVHMTHNEKGDYVLDVTSPIEAVNQYLAVGGVLKTGNLLAIEGVGYKNDYTKMDEAIKSVSDNAALRFGEDVQSIGCGSACENYDA